MLIKEKELSDHLWFKLHLTTVPGVLLNIEERL